MDTLLNEIGQIAIFLICAQTLLHFRAKDSYEKYIKLLISMMLLLLLAEPFLELFDIRGMKSFWEKITEYEQRIESVMGNGMIKESEIEQVLQGITQEKVLQSVEYVQNQATDTIQGESPHELQEKEKTTEQEAVNETKIIIEKVEVGG